MNEEFPLLDEALDGGRKILTVSELTTDIKNVIEGEFSGFWLEGEISNMRLYPSGHVYFTLKDEDAQISAVIWKGLRSRLKFDPRDGDHVIVRGSLSVYEKRGTYQVVVEAMEPKGLGALQAKFEQLKKKLHEEGLFADERKKRIPSIPRTIGIATSPAGAVIRDMIRTIKRRFPAVRIIFCPVAVQGDGAAEQIARAIADLNEHGAAEAIIIGRGGGSLEDLWAFNEEVVARAIAASGIPVVSAVGHETDFTISDFVADARASTPTAAAEMVTPEIGELYARIGDSLKRLEREARSMIADHSQRSDELYDRMDRSMRSILSMRKNGAAGLFRHLNALSPDKKLAARKERLESLRQRLSMGLRHAKEIQLRRSMALVTHLYAVSPQKRLAVQKETLAGLESRLPMAIQRRIDSCARNVSSSATRFVSVKPDKWIMARRDALERVFSRADDMAHKAVVERRRKFEIAAGRLDAYSPLKALGRGYSIVTSPDGKKIHKSVKDLSPGSHIRIRLSDGEALAVVDGGAKSRQKSLFNDTQT